MNDLQDAFVTVSFDDDLERMSSVATEGVGSMYEKWVDNSSGKRSAPEVFGTDALRKLYPGHSLVTSADYSFDLLNFPDAVCLPLSPSELITNTVFVPIARRFGGAAGVLKNQIEFGSFRVAWETYEFTVYITKWVFGLGQIRTQHYILHEGPEEHARALLLAAGAWREKLHNEIWVFNQGFWQKDANLWQEIQKADWKDVVLKDQFKTALKKDIYGFFESEETYKKLSIPWRRGLIMYGPPGNGKTISIKAVMKSCDEKGFLPLYIKSFKSFRGEEAGMESVFDKARQESPCVVILEDLDSLINDQNRSFFLNQLDGLEGNDGLLVIGTTNHFDRLDPGLSTRPSRFDRKFLFDDPDRDERALYAKYWQQKLKDNDDVSFPDSLVDEVADSTDKFSFAYLKEAFVSSLVLLVGDEKDSEFGDILKGQIKELKDQLRKSVSSGELRYIQPSLPSVGQGLTERLQGPRILRRVPSVVTAMYERLG